MRKLALLVFLALLTGLARAVVPAAPSAPAIVPLPIKGGTLQILGDSKAAVCSTYVPTIGATNAGGVKSLCSPATWVEAALRGVQFDMTVAPRGPLGYVVGLKQLRDYAGTGCTAATATVTGATGFSATGTISGGHIVGWTVTAPQTSGTASTTYTAVSITSDCTGSVYATPVTAGSGNFGIGGQSLLEIRERAVDLCLGTYGAKPNIVMIMGGDNDLALSGNLNGWTNAGATLTLTGSVLAKRMMNIVRDLAACGITSQVIAHPVRSIGGLTSAGYTTAQAQIVKKTLAEMNHALRLAANGSATFNSGKTFFLFVDGYLPYYVDNSSANGDPINYLTSDGTHPSQWGGAVIGYWAAKQLLPYVQSAGFSSPVPALDAYDATYNVSGNISNTMWNGSAGTPSGLISGTIPSATFNSNSGGTAPSAGCITATTTVPSSSARDISGLVTPSLTLAYSCGAVSSTGSSNVVISQVRWGTTLPSGIASGDYLEAACDVEYASLNNIVAISVGLQDSTNSMIYFMGGVNADYMPRSSDPLVGSAGALGWFGWPLRFHSAPMLVQSNSASYQVQLSTYMDASASPGSSAIGGSAGVTGTIKFRNCTVQEYGAGISPALQ